MTTGTFNAILVHADAALEDGIASDELAATLAYELHVPADTIADDVAELFERLTIAADLAEDPEHAFFIHYDETYHGGDMTALREHELDAARQAAERIAEKVPA
jgi:hypothetical protein